MACHLKLVMIFVTVIFHCNGKTAKAKKPMLTVVSIDECRLAGKQLDTQNKVEYSLQARKVSRQKTLIKASFEVTRKFGPIMFTLAVFQLQRNNVRDLTLRLDKMKCSNPIPMEFMRQLKIKFDSDCYILPNKYEVDNIDVQDNVAAFSKTLTTLTTPGKYAFDLEFWSPMGIVACVSFTINLTFA